MLSTHPPIRRRTLLLALRSFTARPPEDGAERLALAVLLRALGEGVGDGDQLDGGDGLFLLGEGGRSGAGSRAPT